MYEGRFMSPIIVSAMEVMLVYACESRARMQRVLDPIGSMYASDCVHIFCTHVQLRVARIMVASLEQVRFYCELG